MDCETQMSEINWYLFEHIFFFQITLLVITSFFSTRDFSLSLLTRFLFRSFCWYSVLYSCWTGGLRVHRSCHCICCCLMHIHNDRPVKPPLDYTLLPNNNDDNHNNGTKCRLLHCCIPPPTHLLVTLHCFAFLQHAQHFFRSYFTINAACS